MFSLLCGTLYLYLNVTRGNCSNGNPCNDLDGSCQYECGIRVYGKTCDENIVYIVIWTGTYIFNIQIEHTL